MSCPNCASPHAVLAQIFYTSCSNTDLSHIKSFYRGDKRYSVFRVKIFLCKCLSVGTARNARSDMRTARFAVLDMHAALNAQSDMRLALNVQSDMRTERNAQRICVRRRMDNKICITVRN